MWQKPSRAEFSPEIALRMLHLMFRKLELVIIFCGIYRMFFLQYGSHWEKLALVITVAVTALAVIAHYFIWPVEMIGPIPTLISVVVLQALFLFVLLAGHHIGSGSVLLISVVGFCAILTAVGFWRVFSAREKAR
jgi:hypothetical protein